jgi:hypothetical protein
MLKSSWLNLRIKDAFLERNLGSSQGPEALAGGAKCNFEKEFIGTLILLKLKKHRAWRSCWSIIVQLGPSKTEI